MIKQSIIIPNKLGLHARASAKLVQLANTFNSVIIIQKDNKYANAKSIMAMMMLSASFGSQVIIQADGSDQELALNSIFELINNKFGESE